MRLSHIFTYDIRVDKLFDIPEQPINVMLDVTDQCNNHCLFCYNPRNTIKQNKKPDIDSLKKIVSIIGQNGTKEILYLGGEPFSFPEMRDILITGKEFGMFQRVISNGSFLKNEIVCKCLKESGLNEVGVSFHSANETIHDRLADRKGAFRDAMLAIEYSLNAGIATFVQYSPTRLNLLGDVLELAKNIKNIFGNKILYFDINRLIPLGKGYSSQELFLEDDRWFLFLCEATKLYQLGYDVHVELTPFCWLKNRARLYGIVDTITNAIFNMNRGCFMWVAQLALDYEGRIKFCPAGNYVGPSILEVKWPEFWKTWDGFKQYRNFMWNDTCVDFENNSACPFLYRCLGGCKYSKGTHYEVDRYAINFVKETNNEGLNEKSY